MSYKQEFEVRVLNVDSNEFSQRITGLGRELVFSGIQERNIFEIPHSKDEKSWLRLRTNLDGTTLAIKSQKDGSISEVEVSVSDYETMLAILEKLGINSKARHQNHRQLFRFPNGDEICIDTWPGLDPFAEIESQSEDGMWAVVASLGLLEEETSSLNIVEIYELAGITDISDKDLVFSPEELEGRGL